MQLHFDNQFTRVLPQDAQTDPPGSSPQPRPVQGALWSAVMPQPVAAPQVLAVSADMLAALGLSEADARTDAFAQVFAGNALLPGMRPYASNYGGHQFGHWAGQLGDGRAIALGEALGPDGRRWVLQLKGAGRTPYSRRGDGRAVLRSSIREFLCSEAMHHLGVPTTRALSLVATGEPVLRDLFYDGHPRWEPGAIVCRAAPSFVRFGHFELPAARGDTPLLRQLLNFCVQRDFAHLAALPEPERHAAWLHEVAQRTARLVVEWMRVGFVHGVMNTDNLSTSGLTIDYGPYGWLDAFDPDFTPNTTDAAQRRYRFGFQPRVALWNLQKLAGALLPLLPDAAPLNAALAAYSQTYAQAEAHNAARKLGLPDSHAPQALPLLRALHAWLHRAEADMSLFFRALGDHPLADLGLAQLAESFYKPEQAQAQQAGLQDWLAQYRALAAQAGVGEDARRARMRQANPRFILRNWIAQEVIEHAERGDLAPLHTVLRLLERPYDEQPGDAPYVRRRPDWAADKPGCSSLSCSS